MSDLRSEIEKAKLKYGAKAAGAEAQEKAYEGLFSAANKIAEWMDKSKAFMHDVKDKAVEMKDNASEKLHDMKESAEDKMHEMKENAEISAHENSEKLRAHFSDMQAYMRELKDKSSDKYEEIKLEMSAFFDKAFDKADDKTKEIYADYKRNERENKIEEYTNNNRM